MGALGEAKGEKRGELQLDPAEIDSLACRWAWAAGVGGWRGLVAAVVGSAEIPSLGG